MVEKKHKLNLIHNKNKNMSYNKHGLLYKKMKEIQKGLIVSKKKIRAPKTPDTIFSYLDKCSARVDYNQGEISGSDTSEQQKLNEELNIKKTILKQ